MQKGCGGGVTEFVYTLPLLPFEVKPVGVREGERDIFGLQERAKFECETRERIKGSQPPVLIFLKDVGIVDCCRKLFCWSPLHSIFNFLTTNVRFITIHR